MKISEYHVGDYFRVPETLINFAGGIAVARSGVRDQ